MMTDKKSKVAPAGIDAATVFRVYVQRLYVIADAHGLSKSELSRRLGWTERNLQHLFAERHAVKASTLDAIARYENRAISALLKDLTLLATELEMGGPPVVRMPTGATVRLDVALDLIRRRRGAVSRRARGRIRPV